MHACVQQSTEKKTTHDSHVIPSFRSIYLHDFHFATIAISVYLYTFLLGPDDERAGTHLANRCENGELDRYADSVTGK